MLLHKGENVVKLHILQNWPGQLQNCQPRSKDDLGIALEKQKVPHSQENCVRKVVRQRRDEPLVGVQLGFHAHATQTLGRLRHKLQGQLIELIQPLPEAWEAVLVNLGVLEALHKLHHHEKRLLLRSGVHQEHGRHRTHPLAVSNFRHKYSVGVQDPTQTFNANLRAAYPKEPMIGHGSHHVHLNGMLYVGLQGHGQAARVKSRICTAALLDLQHPRPDQVSQRRMHPCGTHHGTMAPHFAILAPAEGVPRLIQNGPPSEHLLVGLQLQGRCGALGAVVRLVAQVLRCSLGGRGKGQQAAGGARGAGLGRAEDRLGSRAARLVSPMSLG
mmetsp:Transcript_34645/g.84830  ORF Transcript_34645/g.84830 Transcript_34645/m.84830 type:complete len:329 (-) Transcript_34645:60-1046(-)